MSAGAGGVPGGQRRPGERDEGTDRSADTGAPASGSPRPSTVPGVLYGGPGAREAYSGRKRTRLRAAIYALLAPPLRGVARGLWRTWRYELDEREDGQLAAALAAGPVVLAMWHAQLIPGVLHLLERCESAERPLAFLVSPSVDGDLVARLLERSGGVVARGSATRSGVKALRQIHRLLKADGASPLILVDGPQGPARTAKPGALLLAQLGRVPLIPLALVPAHAWRLSTWDRLLLPRPFTRVRLALGPPRAVPLRTSAAELEHLRRELELELDELTRRAAGR